MKNIEKKWTLYLMGGSDEFAAKNDKITTDYGQYVDHHISTVKSVWDWIFKKYDGKALWLADYEMCYLVDEVIGRHDESKYSRQEFTQYSDYFYGDKKNKKQFDEAWNHHQKHNEHHWEYWCLIGKSGAITTLEMPHCFVMEMLCDWTAMSIKFKNIPSEWFAKNVEDMVLHDETRRLIDKFMPIFDEAYHALTEEN